MTLQSVLAYILVAVLATVAQLLILLGPVLLLVALASWLSSLIYHFATRTIGESLYLLLFGWFGISLHEIAHAFFNKLFRHNITDVQLFNPAGPVYGHVSITYNRNSIYQKIGLFFAGLAPPLFGAAVIYLAAFLLLPADINTAIRSINPSSQPISIFDGFNLLFDRILLSCIAIVGFLLQPENFSNISFWLFVYIAFAVGSSIRLSPADINVAKNGLSTIIAALLVFNLATLWMGDFVLKGVFAISQSFVFFYALLIFVIILNLFAVTLLWLLALLMGVR